MKCQTCRFCVRDITNHRRHCGHIKNMTRDELGFFSLYNIAYLNTDKCTLNEDGEQIELYKFDYKKGIV